MSEFQPAESGDPSPARSSQPLLAMFASRAMRLALLGGAGLLLQLGCVMIWALSYRLTHGNDFTYQLLVSQSVLWEKLQDVLALGNTLVPGLEVPGVGPTSLDIVVYALVAAFVVAGLGYLAGVLLIDHGIAAVPGALVVVLAFELLFQFTLFWIPGLYTTDIFSYVMYGQISAVYNLNPYIFPPNYFPGNELLNWIHPIWHDQPSVYGPLWTDLAWVFARVIAPLSLMDQVLAYKVLMNGVQLVNLGLVWWLVSRLMSSRRARLTAFTVFAWNPLMLFDGPGNAHNDVLMVTLLLLGVLPLTYSLGNRSWLVGTFSVGMSALIKYTTGLVGLLYIVPWARRLSSWPARIAWLGATGALVVGVTLALFWPWLEPRALEPILTAANGKVWQYSNSAPDVIALQIDNKLLHEPSLNPEAENHFYLYGDLYATSTTNDTRATWKLIARMVFAIYLAWECIRLWRVAGCSAAPLLPAVLSASVRVFTVLILLVLPWVLDWYWMWPLALATLLGWRSTLTKVVVAYTLLCLPIFYMHHYWSSNTPSGLVFAYALPPLAIPLIAWLVQRLTSSPRRRQLQVGSLVAAPSVGGE